MVEEIERARPDARGRITFDDAPLALYLKLDKSVSLGSIVGSEEPPAALQRWVEERVLSATFDDGC